MIITIDAMGGDNAPFEIVKGAYNAAIENADIELQLVGDEAKIIDCFKDLEVKKPDNISIVHTDVCVTMEDDPSCIMKDKKENRMSHI